MPTYLITFSCYGHIVHGDPLCSVDRAHNGYRQAPVKISSRRSEYQRSLMREAPYRLDRTRGEAVLAAIREVAAYRDWYVHAAHVRPTHVHVVVTAPGYRPEPVMNQFKAYATRRLQQLAGEAPRTHRWSRHGSTRYLWTTAGVLAAIRYVVERQGGQLAWFQASPAAPAAPG